MTYAIFPYNAVKNIVITLVLDFALLFFANIDVTKHA